MENQIEKMGPEEALRLVVATENASTHHQRSNVNEITNLSHDLTLGRWAKPRIVTNKKGVVLQGLNHLHAIIQTGKEVFVGREIVIVKRGPRVNKTTSQLLTVLGVSEAPMRLGILRAIYGAVYSEYEDPSIEKWGELLREECFDAAFKDLHDSYLLVKGHKDLQEKRGRMRLGMAPFILSYYAAPSRVRNLYTLFLQGGPSDPNNPISRLIETVKSPLDTQEDRIHYMQKAATLMTKAVTGQKAETLVTDTKAGMDDARAFFNLYRGRLDVK